MFSILFRFMCVQPEQCGGQGTGKSPAESLGLEQISVSLSVQYNIFFTRMIVTTVLHGVTQCVTQWDIIRKSRGGIMVNVVPREVPRHNIHQDTSKAFS